MFDLLPTSEIREIVAGNMPEDIVDATPAWIMSQRDKAMQTQKLQPTVFVRLDMPSLDALFGFRLAKEGEIPRHFRDGKKEKWVSDWNTSNRPIGEANLAKLLQAMLGDRFVPTPEPFIFLSDGMCASAQHRGWAMRETMLSNPEYKPVIALSFGLDYRLADVLDRAAKRQNKDIGVRNHFIPDDLVAELPDATRVVSTLNRELNTYAKIIWHRSQGRDIKASGEFDASSYGQMLMRLDGYDQFLVGLYKAGKEADQLSDSEGVKMFGRPNIAAMLTLAVNTDNPADWVADKTKRIFTLPDAIHLPDDELVDGFMSVLNDNRQGSPFATVFAKWKSATDKHPQRKVGILQAMVQHYLATREEHVVMPPPDEATGQPLPNAKPTTEWTCKPVDDAWFARIDPKAPIRRKTGGEVPPAYQWNCFGGLDCGYLGRLSSSN